ncbi:MAG TPA: hypothetical protein DCX46_07755 [Bacteroidetes bacterium]|nr:hypothetical protein [Bacteroidota bacterium]
MFLLYVARDILLIDSSNAGTAMNRLSELYTSSVGKKIIMSLSGLFLCTFLVVHVGINLLLFKSDGGASYNEFSNFLSSNVIIRTIEIVLFVGLIAHVVSGAVVWMKNRASRPVRYEVYKLSDNTSFSSRTPMLTAGAGLVGFFLV